MPQTYKPFLEVRRLNKIGILNVLYKVSLISLIDFTDGGWITDIINIPKGNSYICMTGCIVCPNGKMIFVDWYNRRLLIHNDDGTLDKEIPSSLGQPRDVAYLEDLYRRRVYNRHNLCLFSLHCLDNNWLRTCFYGNGYKRCHSRHYTDTTKGIEIINIDTKKSERSINTCQVCHGKMYHNGVLLWCEEQRAIQMMKLSDDRITTLVKQSNFPLTSI
jgi:hypothetical protein